MKKRLQLIVIFSLILILSFSFVSANVFGDFWDWISGKDRVQLSPCEEGQEYVCPKDFVETASSSGFAQSYFSGVGCSGIEYKSAFGISYRADEHVVCKSIASYNINYVSFKNSNGCYNAGGPVNNGYEIREKVCVSTKPYDPVCGNSIIESSNGEQCDDGNTNDNDACKSDCKLNICGDGIIYNVKEQCDDKNTILGDGCNGVCQVNSGWSC